MKLMFTFFRYVLAIPIYIIRYPTIILLKVFIFLFSLGAIISLLFAYFGGDNILYTRAFEYSVMSAVSGLFYYLFNVLLHWVSPYYQWLEQRNELHYFDKEYRLDEYKNERRYRETGYDEWASQQLMFDIYAEQQNIEEQNNYINNNLIYKD